MTPFAERFFNWVEPEPNSGCWLWIGGDNGEYGLCNPVNGYEQEYAHRWSYEFARGPIPDGLELDHLCRTPRCVNPAHLEIVTPKENTLRGRSFSAVNARKTTCPQGHPYSPENTSIRHGKRHGRACKRCRREQSRTYYWIRKRLEEMG